MAQVALHFEDGDGGAVELKEGYAEGWDVTSCFEAGQETVRSFADARYLDAVICWIDTVRVRIIGLISE